MEVINQYHRNHCLDMILTFYLYSFMKTPFKLILILVLMGGLTLTGCDEVDNGAGDTTGQTETTTPAPASNTPQQQSDWSTYTPRLSGKAVVEFEINGGQVIVELDGDNAPVTAGNFANLVAQGFYDGLSFHRVINTPENKFVAQGGDPDGNGSGGYVDPATGQKSSIPLEIAVNGEGEPRYSQAFGPQNRNPNPNVVLPHKEGAIAMARSNMPDSASSQFYIAVTDLSCPNPRICLDGDYAVFGYVTEGMDVVQAIKQGDLITSAKITSGEENLQQ